MNYHIILILILITFAQACQDKNCVFCPHSPSECQKCEEGYKVEEKGCKRCWDKNCV